MNKKALSYLILVLFFVVLGVNYLTAMGTLPGIMPQKEVSGIFHTPMTPAGFTFSIWGVIYFSLFLAILYMIRISSENGREAEIVPQLTIPILGVFGFNIVWNVVFGYFMIGTSVFMILGYFTCLMEIEIKILKFFHRINPILNIAFGIHIGWIAIATIVNIYAYLVKIGIESLTFEPEKWIVIGVILAIFLALLLTFLLKNSFIPLSIAWALFGIYAKGEVFYNDNKIITIILLGGTVVSVLIALIGLLFKKVE